MVPALALASAPVNESHDAQVPAVLSADHSSSNNSTRALAPSEPVTPESAPQNKLPLPTPTTTNDLLLPPGQANDHAQDTMWREIVREWANAARTSQSSTPKDRPILSDTNDLDPSLKRSVSLTTNRDLLQPIHGGRTTPEDYATRLQQGRKLKDQGAPSAASKIFIELLYSSAPSAVKRGALLELAVMAHEQRRLTTAQQIYSQFLSTFPEDPNVAEVYLRLGLIYREMGANEIALSKFALVFTCALNGTIDNLEHYQRLVLQAQAETAETIYQQGKFDRAAEYYHKLLRLKSPYLDQNRIRAKTIQCYHRTGRHQEILPQAVEYLKNCATCPDAAEVRFIYALALKSLGRVTESVEQVHTLLASQQASALSNPTDWFYWQQRAGNEIANQLYKEGLYLQALDVYIKLADLDNNVAWQLPVLYQVGLCFERIEAPIKAIEYYQRMLERQKDVEKSGSPSLHALLDLAKWRSNVLGWSQQLRQSKDVLPSGGSPNLSANQTKQP